MSMSKMASSDDYHAIIHADQIPLPCKEHGIKVTENVCNSVFQGYSFSPLSEKTVYADNAVTASSSNTAIESGECSSE